MADLAPDLRVISLWQPWASFLADPDLPKTIETRPKAWPSTIPLPAWVLIHSSAKRPEAWAKVGDHRVVPVNHGRGWYLTQQMDGAEIGRRPLWLGAVIGAAHVTACPPIVEDRSRLPIAKRYGERCLVLDNGGLTLWSHDQDGLGSAWRRRLDLTADLPYGDYRPGRFGYLTDRTVLFPEPIPHKGAQGFQRATPELIAAVALQCPEVTR